MVKKLLKNKDGKWSWMKVGGFIAAVAGAVVALPATGVAVPVVVVAWAKIVGCIAASVGISGARDAFDNNKSSTTIINSGK